MYIHPCNCKVHGVCAHFCLKYLCADKGGARGAFEVTLRGKLLTATEIAETASEQLEYTCTTSHLLVMLKESKMQNKGGLLILSSSITIATRKAY